MKKAIILCLAMLLLSFFAFKEIVVQADAATLLSCAHGVIVGSCDQYPPVIPMVLSLISNRTDLPIYLFLIIAAVIVPLTLVKITGQQITAWFYFTGTNFYFALVSTGFYAQTLAVIMTLAMLLTKRWYVRLGLLLLASFTHTSGFLMAAAFWLVLSLQEQNTEGLFVCSPFFGKETPAVMNTGLFKSAAGFQDLSLGTILAVFIKRLPFFFLIPALLSLWKKGAMAILFLFCSFFIAGIVINDRGFYMAAIPMVIGLSYYFKEQDGDYQVFIVLASIAFFAFNLIQMYNLMKIC